MTLEENKTVVRRMYDAFNKQDLARLDELIAPEYVDHPRQFRSLERYKQHLAAWYKGFPDSHEAIEDIIAEGDRVWVRVKGTGTNRGEYLGLAPTGKKAKWEAIGIWRIVDGKAVEMWAVSDMLDFLKQLGGIEYTEKAKKLFPGNV